MEPGELTRLLIKLQRKAPDVYRHILGLTRVLMNEPSPEQAERKEERKKEKEFFKGFNL